MEVLFTSFCLSRDDAVWTVESESVAISDSQLYAMQGRRDNTLTRYFHEQTARPSKNRRVG